MLIKSWFFDIMLYIYALSLLFTFSDFIQRNRKAKWIGTGLLVCVWVLQTTLLVMQLINSGRIIDYSIFDSLLLFSWLLITFCLLLTLFVRIELAFFFISLAGFIVAAISIFSSKTITPLAASWEIHDELLFIHVSLAIGSYVAFFCSAMFSGMLIFLYTGLKKKHYSDTIRRMPSLERIHQYAIRAVIAGTPLLLLSLVLGIIWIFLEEQWTLLLDIKVILSVLIIMMYGMYIWKHVTANRTWRRMANINLIAFTLVVLNYTSSSWLSNFH